MEFIQNNDDYTLIIKLEEYFISIYNEINYNIPPIDSRDARSPLVCCTLEERSNIIHYAYIIKSIIPYSTMSLKDIYSVLIFIYYSLSYNEQTTDWLVLSDLYAFIGELDDTGNLVILNRINKRAVKKAFKKAEKLYYDISVRDIMYINPISGLESNLSSEIRKTFLNMAEGKKNKLYNTTRQAKKAKKARKAKTFRNKKQKKLYKKQLKDIKLIL